MQIRWKKLSKLSANYMTESLLQATSEKRGLIVTVYAFALIFDYRYINSNLQNRLQRAKRPPGWAAFDCFTP